MERLICEQILFVEEADKEYRHISEEVVYNDLIETLQPAERWGPNHQKAYKEQSMEVYLEQLGFINRWVENHIAEVR